MGFNKDAFLKALDDEMNKIEEDRETAKKAANAQRAYNSYMGSQEQKQNQQKANRDAFQEAIDRVFAVPGASASDMPLNVASPLPKDEKAQQLKAEVNYRKAQQQAEEDRAVIENDLATFEKWDKEDQLKLLKFIENGMGSFNAILGAANGSAQAEAYLAKKELEDKYGADVISRIATSVSRSKTQKLAKEMQEIGTQTAQEYPVLGSVASVPMNLIGSVAAPIGYLSEVIRGGKGQYNTLDPNNLGSIPGQYAGTVRQGVSQRIEGEDGNWLRKIAAIGYEGVMSAADSGARLAAGGFNPGVSAGIAASQNFGSSMQQYSAQGATPEQAAAAALASSGIEYISEKIPMDELLKVGKGGNVWKDILKQAFLVEPTTEEISLFANVAAEAAILGEKSDRGQRIGELIAGGATYKEAKAQVNKELWSEAARTYAVSAVSGFAGAGGAAMGNRGTDVQVQPELTQEQRLAMEIDSLGTQLAENAPAQATQPEADRALQNAIDEALGVKRSVDANTGSNYNNTINNGGTEYDRGTGTGDSSEGMAGVQRRDGYETEGRREHGGVAQHSGVLRLSKDLENARASRGVQSYELYDTSESPQQFEQALIDGRNSDPRNGWCVTPKSAQELKDGNYRTFMNENGTVGLGVASDGDIVAVFKNKNGGPKRAMDTAMPAAIEMGGDRLDCYGSGLVTVYENYGFVPVARVEFNPEYANDGWTPDKGTPYIYFMMHNGDSAADVTAKMHTYKHSDKAALDSLPTFGKDDYDAAMEYRNSLIEQRKRSGIKGTGAAERGFSPKYALIDQYGAIPEGENPVRADQLPASITGDDRVSYTARTALEAEATPDEFAELIENETMRGGFSYIPISNDETVQAATEAIRTEGWRTARADWTADVRAGRTSPEITATGALLYNHAVNSGDYQEAMDILVDYQLSVRNSAQALQAARILKTLTPSDRLYMIRRSVDRMVEDMHLDRDIVINEDLARQYQEAGTQEEADEILDQIAADVAKQIKPKGMEAFTALRYLNMLGNLRTQVRNVAGNVGSKMTYAVKNQIAAAIEDVVSAINPDYQRNKVHFVNRETKRAALADYENVRDWIMGGGKYSDRSESDQFAQMVQGKRKILPPVFEQYRRATNWAMEAGDQVFSRQAYADALAGYLNARGIKTEDLSTVDPKVLDQARAYAVQQAQEQTFRDNNQVSNFVGGLLRGRNTPTWARVIGEGIMPFRKTPANVLVRAEEFSPLGVINSAVNTYRAARGQITGADLVESWAKSLTGVGLFALGSALHDMGFLTGGPDPDEEKEAFETMSGYQNYALMLPDGTNMTIDFLSPMAIPLFLGAQFDQVRTAETDMGWDDYEKLLTSLGDPLIQMSMLQGVNDTLENLRYADNTMGQFLLNAMASYLTQGLTNTLAGQIERSTEENRMTTYIDKDSDMPQWLQRQIGKASQKIPGLDYQQTEYRDALGRTQENYGGSTGGRLLYNLLSPGYLSKAEETALTEELNRLRDATGENVYPQAPEKSFNYTDTKGNRHNGYNLSAEEMDTMQKVQGETAADLLNTIIRSKDYKALTDAQKASVIQNVYSYAQEQGKKAALPDYHSTAAAWMGKLGNNKAAGIIRRGALSEIDRAIDDAVNSFENGWAVTGAAKADIEEVAKAFDKMSADAKEKALEDASGNASRFLEMRMEGLSTDDYLDIAKAIAGLNPEEGKKTVSDSQKWEAISKSGKLTDAEKDAAIKAYMTDYNPESSSPNTTELKYDYARQELGISPEEYIEIISAEGKKAERIQAWQEMGYNKEEATALWNLFGSTSKSEKTDVVSWYNSKGK